MGVGGDSVRRGCSSLLRATFFSPGMQGRIEARMTATILQASMMGREAATAVATSAHIRLSTTQKVKYPCRERYLGAA